MTRYLPVLVVGVLCAGCPRETPVEHVKLEFPSGSTSTNAEDRVFQLGISIIRSFRNLLPGDAIYTPDVGALEGDYVVVRGGGSLGSNTCQPVTLAEADTITEKEFYKRGVIVPPARVSLNYNVSLDGTVVASDHDSLAMLSGYVLFDQVSAFYRDVVGDRSRATQTRAEVAFFTEFGVGCDPNVDDPIRAPPILPVLVADNAAYARTADQFIILRDALLSSGAEFGLNPGIIAHEFGHRVFQQNVWASSDAGFHRMVLLTALSDASDEEKKRIAAELCIDPTPLDDFPDCGATSVILNGMDEGTADIYAYTYTGVPDFLFSRSINSDAISEPLMRDLSRDPELVGEMPVYGRDILIPLLENNAFQFYRLGTLWSRGYYASIVNPANGERPHDEAERVAFARAHYARAVLRAQRRLGEAFLVEYRFEPQHLVRLFIDEVSRNDDGSFNSAVHTAACQAMCDRFGPDIVVDLNGVGAQCSGFSGNNANVEPTVFQCQL